MEPAPKRQRSASGSDGDIAVFDVGGTRFKVLSHLIQSHPSTLLASLLDDISTDAAEPIYVEANPDRFAHILDWYRHGEMHITGGNSLDAMLRDARYFMLPDVVKINGIAHTTKRNDALETREGFLQAILAKWPTLYSYVETLLADVRAHFQREADKSDQVVHASWSEYDFDREGQQHAAKTITLARRRGPNHNQREWIDSTNVCNMQRLQVLVDELSRRGYECTTRCQNDGPISLEVRVAPFGNGHGPHVTPVCIDELTIRTTAVGSQWSVKQAKR